MTAKTEIVSIFEIGAAMAAIHAQELAKATEAIKHLPASDLATITKACATLYPRGTDTLLESIMRAEGKKIRVAEWYMRPNDTEGHAPTCEHKRYAVGNIRKARHGEIGDETWLEAWIA